MTLVTSTTFGHDDLDELWEAEMSQRGLSPISMARVLLNEAETCTNPDDVRWLHESASHLINKA